MTDVDDWYGEHTEDKTHYALVREARPYDPGQQRPRVEPAPMSDWASTVRPQPAEDHVYSGSSISHLYVIFISFCMS